MEASPAAIAAYEGALPDDSRVERKKMFGVPCAFVNRQMFFGTFEGTVIARVGPTRVATLAQQPGMRVFLPMEERPWRDYVQVEMPADPILLAALAAEALRWAAALPEKTKKPKTRKSKG